MSIVGIDSVLRQGLGVVGQVIGNRYSVYRLGGISGVPNGATALVHPLNLVYSNFPARITNTIVSFAQEQEKLYKMWYTCQCDSRLLKIGDCLVETGPSFDDTPDGRAFIYSGQNPLMPTVVYRAEVFSQISRIGNPSGEPEPIQGAFPDQSATKFEEEVLTLQNGLYSMEFSGISASVPIGIQPRQRPGDAQANKYPTATRHGSYVAYLPLLPGFQLQPGDYFTDAGGNRFEVEVASHFTTGLQGIQAIVRSVFV